MKLLSLCFKVFVLGFIIISTSCGCLEASELGTHLLFNEIMQSNVNVLFADMNFPDSWVELYNPTEHDISIFHYYIGTTSDYKKAYRIKTREMVFSHGYTLIYLDKENEGKHADFRLNSTEAGTLFLFNDKGALLDSLSYPAMPAPNISYARSSSQPDAWQYTSKPTPNEPNSALAEGGEESILLPQPLFSMQGHVMNSYEKLTISIPNDIELPSDTHIYLTFDGSWPDASAICVAGNDTTLTIEKSTIIRASLISSHAMCSLPRTESFIFHPRATEIPIISLVTDEAYLYSDSMGIFSHDTIAGNSKPNYDFKWRRPLNMEYLEPNSDAPIFNQIGETAMFGNSTRSAVQKSVKLIANKRFGTKHLKGRFWSGIKSIKKEKAICLRSCTSFSRLEEGLMQNWFGIHMPDLDYQAFAPAIVYINGEYKGFMGLREKSDEDYVWANYGGMEDIEMIETLNATKPESFNFVKEAILADQMSYDEAAMHIDMPNTADITAIQIICSDTDWPYNNVSMWRPMQEGGKWRWIMKDMDMINVAFRCTSPLTFNYLKFLTNSGSPDSQEYNLHKSSEWIWPRMQLMGKLVTMPEFSNLLIDRLQVFMGDFMRWDVINTYLMNQYEILNTEVTQSLISLKKGTKNTFQNGINNDVDFFRARPSEVYKHLSDFYHLGYIIPMKTQNKNFPVTINDISLTEGDFDGACFSERAVRLDSGKESQGWLMHIKSENAETCYSFDSQIINIVPNDFVSSASDKILNIEFETCEIDQMPTSVQSTRQIKNNIVFDSWITADGKKAVRRKNSLHIIHYKNGRRKKILQ